jgi:LytS/YehU family sensor histidine kinase
MKYEYHVEPFSADELEELTLKISDYLHIATENKNDGIITHDVRISHSSAYSPIKNKIMYSAVITIVYDVSQFFLMQSFKSR